MNKHNYIDLNSAYFHSLGSFGSDDRLQHSMIKLESILKNGSILSRQEQIINNGDNSQLSKFLDKYSNPNMASVELT